MPALAEESWTLVPGTLAWAVKEAQTILVTAKNRMDSS
jgi:hypothetical protein